MGDLVAVGKIPLSVPVEGDERAEWERMVREAYCRNATPMEFALFIQQCQTLNLTPVAGQICQIEIWDSEAGCKKRTSIVQIDGFRAVAQRTGDFRGRIGPLWCGKDGEWRDVWLGDGHPLAAKVGILRAGCQEPIWGVARYDSYVRTKKDGKPMRNWATMPDVMLAKCAEAQALRSSFSILGGVYEPSELDQAFNQDSRARVDPQTHPPLIEAPPSWSGTASQNDELANRLEAEGIPRVPENRGLFKEIRSRLVGIPLSEFEEKCTAVINEFLAPT